MPYTDDITEQHQYLAPGHIDYLSLTVANKEEKTFALTAILNEEGEKQYGQRELEARTTDFEFAKDARAWAKRHYPGITVQRD